MPLIATNQIYVADGNVACELEAKGDESILVKDILVANPVSSYISIKIERTTVGYFRVGGELGSHLPILSGRTQHAHDWTTGATAAGDQTSFASLQDAGGAEIVAKSIGGLSASTTYPRAGDFSPAGISGYKGILRYLDEKGIFMGFPIGADQTMIITGAQQAGAMVVIVYDKYTEADITPVMPNGSDSDELLWINYGSSGAALASAATTEYDTPTNPAEFDDFPYGKTAPDRKEITLYGILASDFAPKENDNTDDIGTKYLNLTRERESMFDEAGNGLLLYAQYYSNALNTDYIAEGYSVIGNYSSVDHREPYMIDVPPVFVAGETLIVAMTTVVDGSAQNISISEQEVGLILKTKRI